MNEENLINYYNKFNEDKRLNTRHGQIEFITSIKYIEQYLKEFKNPKIIDIGAGTGKYSKYLCDKGYDVTAIELIKHNLRIIEQNKNIKSYQGNALDLSRFKDNTFDFTILFGPMYHLIDDSLKLQALNEAKRITKKNGIIMVAYIMNEYAMITHGFKEHAILNELDNLDKNYRIFKDKDNLYSMVRIENINKLNKQANLKRIKIITPDGPSNYIRDIINKMNDEEFNYYLKYHLSICERKDLIGACAHTVDILKK